MQNDFSLSQVARDLAPGDVQKYLNRSANWQNIWAHNFTETETGHNFTGFLAPRLADGSFNLSSYNPALCGECEWNAISYEGTPFGKSTSATMSAVQFLIRSHRVFIHHPL